MKIKKLYFILPALLALLVALPLAAGQVKQAAVAKADTVPAGGRQVAPGRAAQPSQQPAPYIPLKPTDRPLAEILKEKGIAAPIPSFKILVDKSDHLLTLYSGDTPLKAYSVDFGEGGLGDKVRQGDRKTPEGQFYIAENSVLSPPDQYLGSRWMRVSYPNIEDAQRGLDNGMIDQATYKEVIRANNNREIPPQKTALGGSIGIHGGSENGVNLGDSWTWGCVGLKNSDVNEIFDYSWVGTELEIRS